MNRKIAVISGASSGIGKEVASLFAAEGMHVICLARNESKLFATVEEIKANGGSAEYITGDVTQVSLLREAAAQIERKYGRVDVLVNSAGGGPVGGISQVSDDEWEQSIALKQMGYVRLTREILPLMKKSEVGSIINIIGVFGKQPHPSFIIGSMTNAALLAFTKALSDELAPYGIRVNAVNPGATDTPLWSQTLEEMAQKLGGEPDQINQEIIAMSPLKRLATPQDVAKVALFFASDSTSFVTGCALNVDGGTYRGTA